MSNNVNPTSRLIDSNSGQILAPRAVLGYVFLNPSFPNLDLKARPLPSEVVRMMIHDHLQPSLTARQEMADIAILRPLVGSVLGSKLAIPHGL